MKIIKYEPAWDTLDLAGVDSTTVYMKPIPTFAMDIGAKGCLLFLHVVADGGAAGSTCTFNAYGWMWGPSSGNASPHARADGSGAWNNIHGYSTLIGRGSPNVTTGSPYATVSGVQSSTEVEYWWRLITNDEDSGVTVLPPYIGVSVTNASDAYTGSVTLGAYLIG